MEADPVKRKLGPPNLRSPADALAAVDRQRHTGHETRLVGVQVERGVRDVPARAHPTAQRYAPVPRSDDFLPWRALGHAGLDGHGRVHEPGKNGVGTYTVAR